MRLGAAASALLIAACATPLRPDPAVDLTGRWTVKAVNGMATGGGDNFFLDLAPATGSAQFGCNRGGGAAVVRNGWLVTGDWIVTVAGCLPRSRMRFEREGFDILGQPAAIERHAAGVRLRNGKGTIDLSR